MGNSEYVAQARHLIKNYESSLQPRQMNSIQTDQLARVSIAVIPDRIVESHQCKAITKLGNRCKNRTLRSKYCQPHLSQLKNLRITNSKIRDAGLGLFNSRVWRPKNTIITEYNGTRSSSPINGIMYYKLTKRNGLTRIVL